MTNKRGSTEEISINLNEQLIPIWVYKKEFLSAIGGDGWKSDLVFSVVVATHDCY